MSMRGGRTREIEQCEKKRRPRSERERKEIKKKKNEERGKGVR